MYNDFTAILSKFERIKDYSIDNDIVPKSVLDIINHKADVIKNVQMEVNICATAYSWNEIQVKSLPKED